MDAVIVGLLILSTALLAVGITMRTMQDQFEVEEAAIFARGYRQANEDREAELNRELEAIFKAIDIELPEKNLGPTSQEA